MTVLRDFCKYLGRERIKRRREIFNALSTSALILTILFLPAMGFSSVEAEWFGAPITAGDNPVTLNIRFSDESEIILVFDFAGAELHPAVDRTGYEAEIPGEGHTSIEGVPSLPKVSRLVAIPPRSKVALNYEYGDVILRKDIDLLPTMRQPVRNIKPDSELEYDNDIYGSDRQFPEELVEIGQPAILGGLRVIRVTVNPLRYNPVKRTLSLYRQIEVTLKFEDGGRVNTLSMDTRKVSRSYYDLYESKVVNFRQFDSELEREMGSMLIIAPNNPSVLSMLQSLVNWKIRMGYNTALADLSQTGGTPAEIKSFIQNAYDTWEPKLAYLILIGDCAGAISVPPSNLWGDHDYALLDGDDMLADIAVGRFSCANTTQLMTEINKVIGYESNPYMGETAWYKKGAVIVDHASSGLSSILTKKGIRFKALLNGYTAVDTLWYTMPGNVASFTSTHINSGIGFYNFRGYHGMSGWSNSNINQLVNSFKLPFVVTITCETGNITGADSEVIEEFFRAGTPGVPTGAIGAIGTGTASTHTRYNNCVDTGIFSAFFDYGIYGFGDALNMGKFNLYMSYPDNPMSVADYSKWNNLIGDPSCQLWTDIPQTMSMTYTDTISVGATSLTMTAADSISGQPLEGVNVCLCGNEIHLLESTDDNGEVFFQLPSMNAGSFDVTCTLHNYQPHLGRVVLETEDVYVSYAEISIDDDNSGVSSGNSDGFINPGETIELGVSLKNYGDSIAAAEITATLSSQDEFVVIIDSTNNYPDLEPSMTSEIIYGFAFSVSQDAVNQYVLPFNLRVDSNQGSWDSYLPLSVSAPEMVYQNHEVLDPNGRIDPGEQSEMEVSVMNTGGLAGENLEAILACEHVFITIIEGASSFGDIGVNQSSTGNPFVVEADSDIIPGTTVYFDLFFSGDNGFTDTTGFELMVGEAEDSDPTGADEYGYYALDNTDIYYLNHPEYDWVEIDPTVPGHQYAGQDLNLNDFGDEQDDTGLIALPFEFTYYGQDFSVISICSNGWVAMGDMTYFTCFRNWYIPSTFLPYGLIAPFWDDLYQVSSPPRKIYIYNDARNHRFIIEWNVRNRAPGNPAEKFQLILLDPEYYPTASGDGEIIFQYAEVHNIFGLWNDNHFATVGIESPDNLMGLEYSYWNHYAAGAAVLTDGRAIKFTTNTPVHLSPPVIDDLTITVSGDDLILDWGDAPGAVIYHIYRFTQPYFSILGMAPYDSSTASEYTDSGAANEGSLYYRVTWEDEIY